MKPSVISAKTFQQLVLQWFDTHGRKHLPWQENKTPYRVWLSEVMLQQTQVKTVIPYYERFIKHFPTVEKLANADEDTVFHYWSGLGYYRRARHLHLTAKKIAHEFSGQFPDELSELEKLPGIGRSTASAILSIAFKKKATILDGNVKRVITRFHALTEWMDDKKLWPIAEQYTPHQRCDDYTQAMMDLGATICIRGTPHCQPCPLKNHCLAHQQGIEKTLPAKKASKTLPVRTTSLLIFKNNATILLEKRPTTGVWAGLYCPPETSEPISEDDIRMLCKQRFGLRIKKITTKATFRHTFSHYHLEITPIILHVSHDQTKIMDDPQQIWYKLSDSPKIGLPAPIKKLLTHLEMTS